MTIRTMWSSLMKITTLALILVTLEAQGENVTADAHGEMALQTRDPKFFPFIVFAKVLPEPCPTTDGDMGTCYIHKDCKNLRGNGKGSCAKGFGVCCKFEYECGATTKARSDVSYLVSDGFPHPISNSKSLCEYKVKKENADICQLRLDFVKFDLAQPDQTTTLCTDTFTAGGDSNVICGYNDNQHMYLDVSGKSMPTSIDFNIGSDSYSRMWKIKVTQIACNSEMRVPKGCLQYFDKSSDIIKSFNYRKVSSTQQLANMNYAVCIRPNDGYSGIEYKADEFSLSGDASSTGTTGPLEGDKCKLDYILIPTIKKATPGVAPGPADRFCGTELSTVRTYAMPFIVRVVSNDNEAAIPNADVDNKGFQLTYTQVMN